MVFCLSVLSVTVQYHCYWRKHIGNNKQVKDGSPSLEQPGRVSLGETSLIWSQTRGPPSSHTPTSWATNVQPVESRGGTHAALTSWIRSTERKESNIRVWTHHGWLGILGENELSDPVFLFRLDAASSEEPLGPARSPRPTSESPADRAHVFSHSVSSRLDCWVSYSFSSFNI